MIFAVSLFLAALLCPLNAQSAYATLFLESGAFWEDQRQLLNIRVLERSIRASGTEFPFVVVTGSSTSKGTIDALEQEGMTVSPSALPSAGKAAMWNLTQYDKVIVLEPHVVLLHPIDELTSCPGYCTVHTPPFLYCNDLSVVTPLDKRGLRVFESSLAKDSPSAQAAARGFSPSLYLAFERAALFEPGMEPRSPEALCRLPTSYSLNNLYFYEKMKWDLYRCGQAQNFSIPGFVLSYGYPAGPAFMPQSPGYWYSGLFFELHDIWRQFRSQLSGPYFHAEAFWNSMLAGILLWGTMFLVRVAAASGAFLRLKQRLLLLHSQYGRHPWIAFTEKWTRVLCWLGLSFACSLFAFSAIPPLVTPVLGGSLFFVLSHLAQLEAALCVSVVCAAWEGRWLAGGGSASPLPRGRQRQGTPLWPFPSCRGLAAPAVLKLLGLEAALLVGGLAVLPFLPFPHIAVQVVAVFSVFWSVTAVQGSLLSDAVDVLQQSWSADAVMRKTVTSPPVSPTNTGEVAAPVGGGVYRLVHVNDGSPLVVE